jgi:lipid-A-disaccharide synthase
MYGTPMVMTYQVHPISALVAHLLLWMHPQDLALPNIVAGRRVIPELYLGEGTPEILAKEALGLLKADRAAEVRRDLAEVRRRMGAPGASRRAAEEVLKLVSGR